MSNFRAILYLLGQIFLLRKQWGCKSANWKRNDSARKKEEVAMRGEHSKKTIIGLKGREINSDD